LVEEDSRAFFTYGDHNLDIIGRDGSWVFWQLGRFNEGSEI
jgi:squalene cyclase